MILPKTLVLLLVLLASLADGCKYIKRHLYPQPHLEPHKVKVCGSTNQNNNVIDLTDPVNPEPFYDLTVDEIKKLRAFLEKDPEIRAASPDYVLLNSSYIYTADLLLPPKREVLQYLDHAGPKPQRKARVVIFRGDESPPTLKDYVCFPLPNVEKCELLRLPSRKNPVNFSFRPTLNSDLAAISKFILPEIDKQVGFILKESFGETFTNCTSGLDCLRIVFPVPLGSGVTQTPEKRLSWLNAAYNLPYRSVHPVGFAVLLECSSPYPENWSFRKVMYANNVFETFQDLIDSYNNNRINKTRITKPANNRELFSSLRQRGEFVPPKPQRPPTLVEPDGKRYSVKGKKVDYLGWSFNFRLSPLTGPAIYNVQYKTKRIAYEVALSEVAVFYSAHSPVAQTTNFVDSASLLGYNSKALVPGADCPETATLIPTTFMSDSKKDPEVYQASFCLFEHNNGYPLRRHLSYDIGLGGFYGGMLSHSLILRSILAIGNYDYITDFIFYQNGVVETRVIPTGYVQGVFYTSSERPYGFQIHKNFLGHVHHHVVHFKADVDIDGTSNRYETLDMKEETVNLTAFPETLYSQTRFDRSLKSTELAAVSDYNFDVPKYYLVHNNAEKTDLGELKGFRVQISSVSKNLITKNVGNERTLSWARHQIVVTKQKDHEISSSSIYGMYDSADPTVNFTSFYGDNESTVDEDLVLWITSGTNHIPHTEDIPVTTTTGNNLGFLLLPFNYFPECPSMGSRDAIYVEYIDQNKPELGVRVERNGQTGDQCITPRAFFDEFVAEDPGRILQDEA